MMMLVFGLLAGALSTLSPCVLPIIPILMSSAMQATPQGPFALLGDVALSYTLVGTVLALFGSHLGIDADHVRTLGAMVLSGADRVVEAVLTRHMPAWLIDVVTRY